MLKFYLPKPIPPAPSKANLSSPLTLRDDGEYEQKTSQQTHVSMLWHVCVYGASPGLLSQLNGMVGMLIKLLKVNKSNQNLGSCPARRRTPSEVLSTLFTRDRTTKVISKATVLAQFWDWEEAEKRTTTRNGESELGNDILWEMLQTSMVWLRIWKKTGRDDAVLAHTRWL